MASVVSRECAKRAWRDTIGTIKSAGFTVQAVFVFFLGSAVFSYLKGVEAMLGEAETWVAYTLGPIGFLTVLTFTYNLLSTPFRLERERADAAVGELARARRELEGLRGSERRGSLAIVGLRAEAQLREPPGVAPRHYKVEVRNEGVATIPDCRVQLTDFRGSDGNRKGFLPVLLLPLGPERPYEGDGTFSLHGGETKSVSLAWLDEAASGREIAIASFIRVQTPRLPKSDRYTLTVTAFGGGEPASASYAMHVSDAGKLTLEPILNPT